MKHWAILAVVVATFGALLIIGQPPREGRVATDDNPEQSTELPISIRDESISHKVQRARHEQDSADEHDDADIATLKVQYQTALWRKREKLAAILDELGLHVDVTRLQALELDDATRLALADLLDECAGMEAADTNDPCFGVPNASTPLLEYLWSEPASNGNLVAQRRLADLYPANTEERNTWLYAAAGQGDAVSQIILGQELMEAGEPDNYPEATLWIARAAPIYPEESQRLLDALRPKLTSHECYLIESSLAAEGTDFRC